MTIPRIGELAPDFSLEGIQYGSDPITYKLSDFRGRWVVLFFYPLDFSAVCPTEVKEFSQRFDEFSHHDAMVFGISTQSVNSHREWLAKLGPISYPLLADPQHAASEAYCTLIPSEGVALRGTFIIDQVGRLRYALYHDNAVGRSVTETLRVLAALRTGQMCPAEWQPGQPTIRDTDA